MSMSTEGFIDSSEQVQGQDSGPDYAELSDADFMASLESSPPPAPEAQSDEPPVGEAGEGGEDDDAPLSGTSESEALGNGDDPFGQDSENTPATDDEGQPESDDGEQDPEAETADDEADGEEKGLDYYKAQYDAFMAPFRANNRDITPESPEEIRELAKQGANYHKKMAGMKPHLRTLRTLEKHDLLNTPKLDLLIEAANGNKKAVAELIREAKMDPMDIEISEEAYTPESQLVSQAEVDLDEVIDELKESPHYTKTVDVVTKEWDQQSKQHISQTPQILKIINDHMANGVYDLISDKVARERALGRLIDVPDLEAYRQVGDAMDAQGAFNHLGGNADATSTNGKAPSEQTPSRPSNSRNSSRESLQAKKRAASPTRATAANRTDDTFDPLDLPDDEFMKHFNKSY